jgi:hypothetical protein
METIIGVAILEEGSNVVYSLPKPNRHSDVIKLMSEQEKTIKPIKGIQGFITSTDRFVDRVEAGKIALASGQIKKLLFSDKLYSEDLW